MSSYGQEKRNGRIVFNWIDFATAFTFTAIGFGIAAIIVLPSTPALLLELTWLILWPTFWGYNSSRVVRWLGL